MNMKPLAIALSLAGLLASSGAGAGYAHNYGDVTGMTVTDTIFQRVSGLFSDYHFFQVSSPSLGTGIVQDIQLVTQLGTFLNIDNLKVEFGTDGGVVGLDGNETVTDLVGMGDNVLGQDNLAPGAYFFKITGNVTGWGLEIDGNVANGVEKGAYFFSASAAPVPEAETWAMMAMGLGLVGLQLRRKSMKSEAIQ